MSASYKFALGHSLLELSNQRNEIITLDDLAEPFSRHVCSHLRLADKQATSRSSRFLDACRKFNAGELRKEELIDITTKLGFANVIDAFHVVHDGDIDVRFFTDERKGKESGIRLTEDLFKLSEQYQYQNLPAEIEARWRLVETAWRFNLPRQVMTVAYDPQDELLVVNDRSLERKAITGCRDALNGCRQEARFSTSAAELGEMQWHFKSVVIRSPQSMHHPRWSNRRGGRAAHRLARYDSRRWTSRTCSMACGPAHRYCTLCWRSIEVPP